MLPGVLRGSSVSILVAALAVAGLATACGGKVVVGASSGAGGSGGGSTSSSASATSSSASSATATSSSTGSNACQTPPPVGPLDFCGGTGSGDPPSCGVSVCDQGGNVWDAECTQSGCSCSFNGQPVCTCQFTNGQQGCDGIPDANCCPTPWGSP